MAQARMFVRLTNRPPNGFQPARIIDDETEPKPAAEEEEEEQPSAQEPSDQIPAHVA
jgi:hypothetical protein